MSKLVIFGLEKMAEMAHFYFTRDSEHEVAAFTVDREYRGQDRLFDLPVVAFEDVHESYPPDEYEMFIAVGFKRLNALRTAKYDQAKQKGYKLASYVSSKATAWGDTVHGDNCFILEHQVFQPNVTIGNNVVIWSGNHFGHDVVIEDNVWISSHIVFSGGTRVGKNSFVGVNATLRDNVHIGKNCIIGAGALMLSDAKDNQVYIQKGTPVYRLDSEHFERMMEISQSRRQ
jgi:sugar O-acyltransferase (sialic acid O-acetyltransferase NeuD family)